MTDNKTITDIFPTGLYAQHDLMTAEENDLLMQKINSMRKKYGRGNTNDWFSGVSSPDNCFKLACLTKEVEFQELIKRVKNAVEDCARYHGSFAKYFCVNGWYTVYTTGRYQEFHVHPDMIFSAVYFMKVGEDSQGLHIKGPDHGGMIPPKNKTQDTPYNQEVLIAPPQERTVIIFRSYLEHCVPPSSLKTDRITVAMNFS